MPDPFIELAFQSALNVGALLFGVFGFLYSIFASSASALVRPPIVEPLKLLCKFLAWLIAVNCLIVVYSLYLMMPISTPVDWPRTLLSGGLLISSLGATAISLWLSFGTMQ